MRALISAGACAAASTGLTGAGPGGNLREFLALGCRTGYLSLERLACGWGRPDMIMRLRAAAMLRNTFAADILVRVETPCRSPLPPNCA